MNAGWPSAALALLLAGAAEAGAADFRLGVDDPALLHVLERDGFSFGGLAFEAGDRGNRALHELPGWRTVVEAIGDDLQAAKRADPTLGISMAASHRLFDVRWLKSPLARFELAGVINRLDRAAFHPGTCGETRFVYRLAYRHGEVYSRLPMTVNVVFFERPAGGNCAGVARRWQRLDAALRDAGAQGWRDAGFVREAFRRADLKSVEVNLQSVRWPSTVRPDMGGYAEYVLRVFRPQGATLGPALLENTPDVARLRASPVLRARLLAWLKDPANFAAVDAGVLQLPDEFLATRATSVALHGVHRLANMPFSQLYAESDFAALPFEKGKHVRSAHGALRRLDDLSCTGCHQGRTVAGFHFLGVDPAQTDAVNAIAVGASPHFLGDEARRVRHLEALLAGRVPELERPLSVRAAGEIGAFGAHCGFGDPSFAAWTCAVGLSCQPVVSDARVSRTGVCLPNKPIAGSACQPARAIADANPHRDRMRGTAELDCGARAVCEDSRVGFPGGACSGPCDDLGQGEACGAIALLKPFNDCLGRGDPFGSCLRNNVRPGALKACSREQHCRDDYICSRADDGGVCIPPYFLFQLRLDGHPPPS